tara:strand:+ start:440 stop:634 length:195 start_codon:yes stop_codon:yes gene_type:complete
MAKLITIKYKGSICKACGQPLEIGTKANWYKPGVAYHKAKWEKDMYGKYIPIGCLDANKEVIMM